MGLRVSDLSASDLGISREASLLPFGDPPNAAERGSLVSRPIAVVAPAALVVCVLGIVAGYPAAGQGFPMTAAGKA
jgi:hypothetical protein